MKAIPDEGYFFACPVPCPVPCPVLCPVSCPVPCPVSVQEKSPQIGWPLPLQVLSTRLQHCASTPGLWSSSKSIGSTRRRSIFSHVVACAAPIIGFLILSARASDCYSYYEEPGRASHNLDQIAHTQQGCRAQSFLMLCSWCCAQC